MRALLSIVFLLLVSAGVASAAKIYLILDSPSADTETPVSLTGKVIGHFPTGLVHIVEGNKLLGSCLLKKDGTFSIKLKELLPVGNHKLIAKYRGDAQNAACSSFPIVQQITCVCQNKDPCHTSVAECDGLAPKQHTHEEKSKSESGESGTESKHNNHAVSPHKAESSYDHKGKSGKTYHEGESENKEDSSQNGNTLGESHWVTPSLLPSEVEEHHEQSSHFFMGPLVLAGVVTASVALTLVIVQRRRARTSVLETAVDIESLI